MKLFYDVFVVIARYLPDRSRLNLSLADKTLRYLLYDQFLRGNIDTDVDGTLLDRNSAFNHALVRNDSILLERILGLIENKIAQDSKGEKSPSLKSLCYQKVCLCVQKDSAECFEIFAQKAEIIDTFANDTLINIAIKHNSCRVIGHLIQFDLDHGNPDNVLKYLFAEARTARMVKKICRLGWKHLPVSKDPETCMNALIRHCGSLSIAPSTIDALLEAGYAVDSHYYDGANRKSALEHAAENLSVEAVRRLLERGACIGGYYSIDSRGHDPTVEDCQRRMTPLHWIMNKWPMHRRRNRNRCPWIVHLPLFNPNIEDDTLGIEEDFHPSEVFLRATECKACTDDLNRSNDGGRGAWLEQIQLYLIRLHAGILVLMDHGAGRFINQGGEPAIRRSTDSLALSFRVFYEDEGRDPWYRFLDIARAIITHNRWYLRYIGDHSELQLQYMTIGEGTKPPGYTGTRYDEPNENQDFATLGMICDTLVMSGASIAVEPKQRTQGLRGVPRLLVLLEERFGSVEDITERLNRV
ncbi:hypothetical protein SCUP515_09461 [Seiridium cupressi]